MMSSRCCAGSSTSNWQCGSRSRRPMCPHSISSSKTATSRPSIFRLQVSRAFKRGRIGRTNDAKTEFFPWQGIFYGQIGNKNSECPEFPGGLRLIALSKAGRMKAILFVDDHQVLAKLSCEILEMQGYRAVSAASGEEALQSSRNRVLTSWSRTSAWRV